MYNWSDIEIVSVRMTMPSVKFVVLLYQKQVVFWHFLTVWRLSLDVC